MPTRNDLPPQSGDVPEIGSEPGSIDWPEADAGQPRQPRHPTAMPGLGLRFRLRLRLRPPPPRKSASTASP